jgi:hypothetical protein
LFLYYLDNPLKRSLWVSVIVLIICLTVAIDKFLLKKQNEEAISVCISSQGEIINNQEDTIKQLYDSLKQREDEKEKLISYIKKLKKKRP